MPGRHCGSTALADFFRAHGLPLKETDAIGLGGAPGGACLALPGLSPSHFFLPRNPVLEKDAFTALGVPFDWKFYKDKAQAHEELVNVLASNHPVLLQTDIRYLPHYNTTTHFNGHVIVAAGYDQQKEEVLVADTQFEGLQPVPFKLLMKARFSQAPPLPLMGNAFYLSPDTALPASLSAEVKQNALLRWAAHRRGDTKMKALMGLSAMEKLVREMPSFHEAPDADWVARWTYQVIERRGTGGGAFRRLFAAWLKDVAAEKPALSPAAQAMDRSADLWTQAAEVLKTTSEAPSPQGFAEAAGLLGQALEQETHVVKDIHSVLNPA